MRTPLLALLFAATVGCNGTRSSESPDMSIGDVQACADEANAECALRDSCGPSYAITRTFGTIAACQTRVAQTCVGALAAMGQGSSPAHVEGCAAAYPTETCSDFEDGNPVAACVPPAGTLASGAACGASGQCSSTFCNVGPDAACGTCQPLPGVGDPCQVQADCGRNLACVAGAATLTDGGLATGSCAAFVASGGSCLTGFNPCAGGLACVGENVAMMQSGTCQTQGTTSGTACDSTRRTMSNCNADHGMVCVPTSSTSKGVGTCQAIVLVAAGATCGDVGAAPITGFTACTGGGLCQKAHAADATGTCVAPAADSAPCDNDPSIGPPCLNPAKCVVPVGSTGTAGICTIPNASACM